MGGSIIITVTAIALPALAMPPAVIWVIIAGRVFSASLKIVPPGTHDHTSLKAKRVSVIQQGLTMGKTISQKVLK